MKKIIISTLLFSSILFVGQTYASSTLSLGYAQGKIENAKTMIGINAKYRYEWDSPLGFISSFTYTSANNDSTESWGSYHSHKTSDISYYSLLAGPTYRLNDTFNIFALGGLGRAKVNWLDTYNYPVTTKGENYSDTGFVYSAGMLFDLTESWNADVAYEGGSVKGNALHGFNIGVGYRF